jgi:uncharacterized membrane-anchored protein
MPRGSSIGTPPVTPEALVSHKLVLRMLCILPLIAALAAPALAADAPAPTAQQQAVHKAAAAARAALVKGPASVTLRDQATLALPEHYGFVPRKEAAPLMEAMGNSVDDEFLGLVYPLGDGANTDWFVSLDYSASGYVKDDDARHWNADQLLQSLKDGTEAGNEERAKVGVPPLVVTRWIEPPAYDANTHRLVWSAEAKRKDGADDDPTVNYNTYLLGREGYVSLNLITSASSVAGDQAAAHALLDALTFNSGKRYGDFNSSTDKVAAYGLAALVAGVAAKKLGLLALLAAMGVKFAKVIAIAVAGGLVGAKRWLKSRSARQA